VNSTRLRIVAIALLLSVAFGLGCSKKDESPPPASMSWSFPHSFENIVTLPLTLRVNLSAGLQPRRVRYLVDGELLGVAEQAPYALEWNTDNELALGPHRLEARALDSQNRTLASTVIDIMVPAGDNGFVTGSYGGAGADAAHAVEAMPGGGFAVAGDCVFPGGDVQACLLVFDPAADTRWFRAFGDDLEDHFRGVRVFPDGSFVLGGWTYLAEDEQGPIFWLVRATTSGGLRWSRLLGIPPDFEYGHSVDLAGNDGFIVAGRGSRETPAFALFKSDLAGRYIWGRNYPRGDFSIAYAALQLEDGGMVAVGSWEEDEVARLWLMRTNLRGEVGEEFPGTWEHSYSEGGYYSAGRALRRAHGGGYVIAGGSDRQLWLLKTDDQGEVGGDGSWSRLHARAGYDLGLDVRPATDGGYVATGFTSAGGESPRDLWLLKTDASGNLDGAGAWDLVAGGEGMDEGRSVIELPGGGYVVVGSTDSTGGGLTDWWILRVDAQGNLLQE
jgi:hypothetical protein